MKILSQTFSSLRYKNFRIFWFGQIISSIGTWMQIVGQAWLVLKLTNSPFLLGLVVAFQYLPILFFSLYAGDVADRFKKRYIVIITQSSMALFSLILAILTGFDVITYIEVLMLTALMGLAQTFDVPARQSFMIDLVGKNDLSNAIALNSTIFNLARIIGPAIAGIMIAKIGIKATFYANAISFVPLVIGLFFIDKDGEPSGKRSSLKNSVKELIAFIKTNKVLLDIIILLTILSIFAMNFSVLVPLLAKYTLKQNAIGFGMLMTYMGLGSFFGAMFIAYISKKTSYLKLMIINAFGLNIFQILMAISKNYTQASISIFAAGFCLIAYIILSNTIMQLLSTNELRGRIMSVYSLVFLGVTPLGSIFSGTIANYIGIRFAIFIGAFIGFLVCMYYLKRFLKYATLGV
ncbi:MAG: MFS transporter [Desulfurella sp.]|uniref:MFS transporter n=1 Tax=Desulfurella sp. TaxID=1962857 RepID=UPI003D102BC8